MTFTNPITGGQGTLVRPAIKSPDYDPGVAGWSINRDGSAEFNDLTVRGVFRGTNSVINSDGIFFYDGTPTAGNMVGSWSSMGGTDPYGNFFQPGLIIYDPSNSIFVRLDNGGISMGAMVGGQPDVNDAGGIIDPGAGLMRLTSSSTATLDDPLRFLVSAGEQSSGGTATNPFAKIFDFFGNSQADFYLSGDVIKTDNFGFAETWHTPTFNSGWSAATAIGTLTPVPPFQYRFGAEDTTVLGGSVLCASSGSPSSAIATLPAAYRPVANSAPFPAVMRTSAGATSTVWLYLSAAGNVNINSQTGSAITLGATYSFPRTEIPLGHI